MLKENRGGECLRCGREHTFSDIRYCFECSFWLERLLTTPRTHRVIFDTSSFDFYVVDERKDSLVKGFGGRWFELEYKNGNTLKTNNLWHSGVVPERFRPLIPEKFRGRVRTLVKQ